MESDKVVGWAASSSSKKNFLVINNSMVNGTRIQTFVHGNVITLQPIMEIKTEPGLMEIKTEPGLMSIKKEPGIVDIRQGPIIMAIKQEPGIMHIKEESGIMDIKKVPGLMVRTIPRILATKKKPGIPVIKKEPWRMDIKMEPGLLDIKEEPGLLDIKMEPDTMDIPNNPGIVPIKLKLVPIKKPEVLVLDDDPEMLVVKKEPGEPAVYGRSFIGQGSGGNSAHGATGIPIYGTSAGCPRMSQDPINSITHSGLSAGSSGQPSGQSAIPMQYVGPSTQMGQAKGPPQPHFVSVSSGRARMPLQKEDIKTEADEPMDTSGPVSSLVMSSDGGSGDGGSGPGSQSEQRLKVEDALNYLDQVKYKFGNQPQVYNDFLDIMKEFKSQSIDTPGVIARVSHLFRGHPELIIGFNTFLPPGYKIEIQANDSISLSMIGQGGGYVVTTVQPGLPGPGGHPTSQSTMIHQHPSAPPLTATRPPLSNVSSVSGRMSPQPQVLPGNTSANTSSGSSAFTHSFTSPFVQSAFPSLQSQPVEFNHAINYVNKIKNRFQGQPDKYKQFLEILHTYQKEQRNIKDGHPPSTKHLTEHEVYSQVAKLFETQEDLLQEFGQFLPDATNHQNTSAIDQAKKSVKMSRDFVAVQSKALPSMAQKRPALQPSAQERKKLKESSSFQHGKDISLVEAGRYGTLNDFAFFDKVRSLVKCPAVYKNFLRCLQLYNAELLALNELILLVNPFLAKSPELHNWFKDFVGVKHDSVTSYFVLTHSAAPKPNEKLTEEQLIEIDYSTCKRLGASYCAMPKNNLPPKCSGRSLLPLCKEVLNDVWVSFPAWSEDTAFSSSRKTTFEECIYRVEDERFELDVVIEINAGVIRALESIGKKMTRMSPEELADFELDECLGGTSPTIHQRAIRRIYGEKAPEIIEGLKKQPYMAIPLVLRRLKAKEEEWREAQKQFNKTWKEQTEKFYLKSLDLQGISFKQTDMRALRSKALIQEIGLLFHERQQQLMTTPGPSSPHLTLLYRDRNILDEACLLLLHHVRRQTSIHKEDKRKIKQLLKHFVADLFHHTRMELSDDEDEASPDEQDGRRSPNDNVGNGGRKKNGNGRRGNGGSSKPIPSLVKKETEEATSNPATNEPSVPQGTASSTAKVWSELTKQKKLSTAQESQESRRTIAKRELKLLLSDARAHELTEVGRTSLRDKVNREYLSEMSKDDSLAGPSSDQPSTSKRRATRQSLPQGGESSFSLPAEPSGATRTPIPPRIITTPNPDEDEAYTLFFANNNWYVFLRLHQILCERLSKIYEKATAILMEETKEAQKNPAAEELKLRPKNEIEVSNYYTHFLEMIRNLLDGNIEPSTYEDTLREMFGIHAYIAYTMDKVVNNAVRQLQGIMSDDTSQKCLELFHQAGKKGGNGGFYQNMSQRVVAENWYQTQVEKICGEERAVKIMIFKKQCRMTMELLESDTPAQVDLEEKAKYSNYVTKFLKPDSSIPENIRVALRANPVFLARNVRKWKKKNLLEWKSDKAKRGRDDGQLNVVKIEKMDVDLPTEEVNIPTDTPTEEGTDFKIKTEPGLDQVPSAESDEVVFAQKVVNVAPVGESTLGGNVSEEDTGRDHLVMKSLEKSQKERTAEFLMQENLQCQFNLSSYRMVYLTNSEDCIYLKGAMQRARKTHKKLSMKLSNTFRLWHQKWLTENVPDALTSICDEFLMDKSNVVSPRKTARTSISRADRPPYRKFHKYVLQQE